MTTDPLLSLFPAPLLRLILCGGEGLSAAWGPLAHGGYLAPWNPARGEAVDPMFLTIHDPLRDVSNWSLPLAHWRARLAMVGAKLLDQWRPPSGDFDDEVSRTISAARIHIGASGYVVLEIWYVEPDEDGETLDVWDWHRANGIGGSGLRLASLPHLLTLHAPEVALVLAIWEATRPAAK